MWRSSSFPAITSRHQSENAPHVVRDSGSSGQRDSPRPARLTVALEVGVDGRVRRATASGETTAMRGCVEAHVKAWEFLPQQAPQAMALPFEVDRR